MKYYGYGGVSLSHRGYLRHIVADKNCWTVATCETKTMAVRIARLLNKDIERRKSG